MAFVDVEQITLSLPAASKLCMWIVYYCSDSIIFQGTKGAENNGNTVGNNIKNVKVK